MSRLTTPPSWCKDAIPTPLGWRHPRTNELLISIRLDMAQFETKTEEAETKTEEAIVHEPDVKTPAIAEVKPPKGATRQRKPKNV